MTSLVVLALSLLANGAALYPFSSAMSPNTTAISPYPATLVPNYDLNFTRFGQNPQALVNRARLTSKRVLSVYGASIERSTRSQPRRMSTATLRFKRTPSPAEKIDTRPTPQPTGESSLQTTVHITDEKDFSLIAPKTPGELVSDAEADGIAYCAPGSSDRVCPKTFPVGFITAAAFRKAEDNSYVQITGCIDPKSDIFDPSDAGGQFDVRFPNGAQCTFGGYGASFIELIEPAMNRFCLRCCATPNDQINCNSHQDRQGCLTAISGVYDFPTLGVSCS